MMNWLASARLAATLLTCGIAIGSTPVLAASLIEVTNFGENPTNLRMHVYAPDILASPPPILVAVHYCTGSGPAFFSGTEFRTLADRYGFIVIYPSATRSGNCFDVSSPQALRRGGGSDPVGIMSMVTYVIDTYGADENRVYVAGASSGAMMTNVLLGNYPDVFKAGAAFMGVPFGCFATTDGSSWNSTCANGNLIKTAQEWGALVRAAHPGYTGERPRMQLWHGTADTTLRYPNFGEEIKQWTNVLGLSQTPTFTDHPQANWTRTRYGGTGVDAPVEAISLEGVGHTLPLSGMAAMVIQFFGLDGAAAPDDQPPSTPADLTAPAWTSNSVSLNWSLSTDNVGVSGYDILRAPGAAGGSFVQVATSPTTSFVNSGLSPNTTYRYQVRARDAAGNASLVSNTVTVTTLGGGTGDGVCAATAVVQNQWQDGYVIQPVTVTNRGTAAINGWTVTFSLPSGHTIASYWNATITTIGQTATARNGSYNGTLAPGGSTTFGVQVRRPSGDTQVASAYTCTSP
ncbi:PHB depolymerase family esterase [Archangium violaceum]|uniref:extracellular catalytic domain type 1 short-chain-length polyhydroxyalkanoate depolymerase n=1 Tax=Archangium violaceum TaxID=83451 RepID=UPI00193AEDA8|nr:PHB depolymerase family esterase [Archangium violaceum]QRK13019.1 PHB depolymerase family esterase [Archangium violaceum]